MLYCSKTFAFILFIAFLSPVVYGQYGGDGLQHVHEKYMVERQQDIGYFGRLKFAINAASDIKSGTLIVRLNDNNNKIQHLNKIGKNELSLKIQTKREFENKNLIENFKKHYNFSEVVFIYGSDLPKYLNGELPNPFRDENLILDESIQLKGGPIYYLGGMNEDIFYLLDSNFLIIERPAPSKIYSIPNYNHRTGVLTNNNKKRERNRGVSYLNEKLNILASKN